jgi:hypothetical protein
MLFNLLKLSKHNIVVIIQLQNNTDSALGSWVDEERS